MVSADPILTALDRPRPVPPVTTVAGNDAGDPVPRRLAEMEVAPFSHRCAQLLRAGEHAVLGISSGNSYFSEDRITKLLRWAATRFVRFDVLHPGVEHMVATYIGRGYDTRRARQRADRDSRQIRNRISRACERSGIAPGRYRVGALGDFAHTPGYRRASARIDAALRSDPAFRTVCTEMVRDVLRAGRGDEGEPSSQQLCVGSRYLAAELPYFIDTPDILAVASSVVVYQRVPPFARFLYGATAALVPHPGQGFVQVIG